MMLFSGTFFPLSILPAVLQDIALVFLPLTHLVLLMRMATLPAAGPLLPVSLAWILVATAVFCIVSINLMRRRLIV